MRALLLALVLAPASALLIGARPGVITAVRPSVTLGGLRMDDAPPPPPAREKLGATVDQDGKSNVWAVEPAMQVDKAGDKGLLAFAPVAGVALLALLAIPLLPTLFAANPDQA